MTNPIEKAREQLAGALAKLPPLGVRADNTLVLKRLPIEGEGTELSMFRSDKPSETAATDLTIIAAKVSIYSGFGFLAVGETSGAGVLRAGDHVLEFPRTAAVEAFLNQRLWDPASDAEPLYPEMELVVFELDGVDHRPVRWLPKTLTLKVWVRRVNGP
jgi:hypothetical protein